MIADAPRLFTIAQLKPGAQYAVPCHSAVFIGIQTVPCAILIVHPCTLCIPRIHTHYPVAVAGGQRGGWVAFFADAKTVAAAIVVAALSAALPSGGFVVDGDSRCKYAMRMCGRNGVRRVTRFSYAKSCSAP